MQAYNLDMIWGLFSHLQNVVTMNIYPTEPLLLTHNLSFIYPLSFTLHSFAYLTPSVPAYLSLSLPLGHSLVLYLPLHFGFPLLLHPHGKHEFPKWDQLQVWGHWLYSFLVDSRKVQSKSDFGLIVSFDFS